MSLADVEMLVTAAAVDLLEESMSGYVLAGENLPVSSREADQVLVEIFFLPSDPEPFTLGEDGLDLVEGVLQVSFHYPLNSGTSAGRADYETMRETFYAGAGFRSEDTEDTDQTVTIRKIGRTSYKTDEDYQVHVRVTWFATIPRKGGTS